MKNNGLVDRRPGLTDAQARVLAAVRNSSGAVGVDDLAQRLGLHSNTVREHLGTLVDRRLVLRERMPRPGRGRPSWAYAATDDEALDARQGREVSALAGALARSMREREDDPIEAARAAGRAWGGDLCPPGTKPTSAAAARGLLVEILDEFGFAPHANARHTRVTLGGCPMMDVARAYPDIVCEVHVGLIEGVLAGLGDRRDTVRLAPFASTEGCVLHLDTRTGIES